jgi:hypothetical protein
MRKIGILFVFMLAISLLLIPGSAVFASSLAEDCDYDTVKWEDNPDSCFLYLNNWGKTPITAMSRLSGLAYPHSLHGACTQIESDPGQCFGSCACCNDETGNLGCCTDPDVCQDATECPGVDCELPPEPASCLADASYGYAHCCCCWGVSLAFANKGWSGNDLYDHPRVDNNHPNHFGTSARRDSSGGGDWGITGAPHSECASDIWGLQCNLDDESACLD